MGVGVDVNAIRKQNQIALDSYLDHYHKYLTKELDYFLEEDELTNVDDSDSEMDVDMDDLSNYSVTSRGQPYLVYDITDSLAEQMTADEYEKYYQTIAKIIPHPL